MLTRRAALAVSSPGLLVLFASCAWAIGDRLLYRHLHAVHQKEHRR